VSESQGCSGEKASRQTNEDEVSNPLSRVDTDGGDTTDNPLKEKEELPLGVEPIYTIALRTL
jgi:hypothetical protein